MVRKGLVLSNTGHPFQPCDVKMCSCFAMIEGLQQSLFDMTSLKLCTTSFLQLRFLVNRVLKSKGLKLYHSNRAIRVCYGKKNLG